MSELPDDLRELDRTLRAVRFEPRASLGAEIEGRARTPDAVGSDVPARRRVGWRLLAAVGAGLAAAVAVARQLPSAGSADPVTVDRCCYDLDGGGDDDDGVFIFAERDARVHRLRVYEDRDGSRSFTAADQIRLDRGREPAWQRQTPGALVTIEHCCLDFDGGGPDDDGLLVIGVPPDRIVMAAIYESMSTATEGPPLLR